MSTTYAQRQTTAQNKDASSASSIVDASSQSESLQRKADMANNAAQRAEAPRPNNTGMPDNLKSGIESLSGFSMDDVRVHYNSSKPATVQALAYTQGTDIHVAPGQEKHLPHEAWHVAQQMAGRVSPTTNINGMPVNDNAGLEHEADVMGEKAVTQRKENSEINSKNAPREVLQLKPYGDIDLVCAADVLYLFNGESKRVKGVGFNDGDDDDIDRVLTTFKSFGLEKLGTPNYQGSYSPDQKAAPPGACAEPHAVSNALENLSNKEGITMKNRKKIPIKDIYVGDAVVRKYKHDSYDEGINGTRGSVLAKNSTKVNTCKRCPTCQNWIDANGHVKKEFLPNSTLENAPYPERERKFNKKNVAKTKIAESKETISIDSSKSFHDIDLLGGLRLSEKVTYQDWEKLNNDDELHEINEKKGLRTIIKKQMLKNRIFEMKFIDEKRDAICEEIDNTAVREKNKRKLNETFKKEEYLDGFNWGFYKQKQPSNFEKRSSDFQEGFEKGKAQKINDGYNDGHTKNEDGDFDPPKEEGQFYQQGYDEGKKKAEEEGESECKSIRDEIENQLTEILIGQQINDHDQQINDHLKNIFEILELENSSNQLNDLSSFVSELQEEIYDGTILGLSNSIKLKRILRNIIEKYQ